MATTTNFGWETPDDTDLVKDGALAMRTLGNAIDTSLVDLKGGTTGQVLSKTSNTDMDFTWVTSDDANAIQNAIVDAKGDLIAASAADTPARLAVGNNGETLLADSAATTGLRWQGNYAAGKNKIINGDFNINQRGFTSTTTSGVYTFDRWISANADGTVTYTPQTFTLGTAPVAGYEGKNFYRCVTSGQTASNASAQFVQRIESVRTLAGQTATLSFWAKAGSGTPKLALEVSQSFGTGGSPSSQVDTYGGQITLSTSWARYSVTINIPSISGKTIGSNNDDFLAARAWLSAGSTFDARTGTLGIQSNTFDTWGWQLEVGSVATAFQTATGTLAGELALAQRYYYRAGGTSSYTYFGGGNATSTTNVSLSFYSPVTMRTNPTSVDFSTLAWSYTGGLGTVTGVAIDVATPQITQLNVTGTGLTAGQFVRILANASTNGFIALNAEL